MFIHGRYWLAQQEALRNPKMAHQNPTPEHETVVFVRAEKNTASEKCFGKAGARSCRFVTGSSVFTGQAIEISLALLGLGATLHTRATVMAVHPLGESNLVTVRFEGLTPEVNQLMERWLKTMDDAYRMAYKLPAKSVAA